MFKLLFRTVVLVAAFGLPMLFFSASEIWAGAKKNVAAILGRGGGSQNPAISAPAAIAGPDSPPLPPLEGAAVRDFGEVFRFDVSTSWVMSRWSRVSTGMSQLQLQGYRVPLVTGTASDDLAGALTYYFGPEQRVRKITFNGTTGHPGRLVRLMTSRYGLQLRPANDSGLFVYEGPTEEGDIHSVLRIRPTAVVKADQPYQRFHVDLLLAPPRKG